MYEEKPGMINLGFSVRVVGQPGLASHDGRRTTPPHLSVSLVYLRDILGYLQRINVRFYRFASALVPTPTLEAGLAQLGECCRELDAIATQARRQGVRLALHLDHHIALGCDDDEQAAHSLAAIELQAALLERLQSDGAMVVHVGGAADDRQTLPRFVARYRALSARARGHLAVEHDDAGFSLGALLRLHQQCGIPVVFDYLHWQINNPERLPLGLALGLALATWPAGRRPEVHLSTARTESHVLSAHHQRRARVLPPRPGQHADFVALADAVHLLEAARGLGSFDIMLEAKAGDLALLRLRSQLARGEY
jgi:UV DNA damage endonuclease